ncbi:MAG: type II toxin-antitoxin system VapC family toxin [Candidatus Diapherotrites archaeon]|nr:type II toxin-antitoxin system VapC family toxin [Candidatus Diapherotrites archaeon]
MAQKKIYLDSNVFISLMKKEIGFGQRGLFVEAEQFFVRVKKTGSVIVLSNFLLSEVESVSFYSKSDVLNLLSGFGIDFEEYNASGFVEHKKISDLGIHYPDSFHVALAIISKCDCIVTFNLRDFLPAKKLINVLSPEDF